MLTPSADEKLHLDLASYLRREPRVQEPVDLLLRADLPGSVLRTETAKLAAGATDPDVQAGLQRILADYDARFTEQTSAGLEGEAKSDKDFRSYEAVPVYKSLTALEPTNEEALFDLGQVYGVLKQNRNEIPVYGQLLRIDPLHREGNVALERSGLEIQPRAILNTDFLADKGRDGLARIQRQRYQSWVALPWGDENEFVQFCFARVRYQPHDDSALEGNIRSARVQHKIGERLLL